MSVFDDAKHLASWAGLCPGNRESGGKRMSGRTRKANRYVRRGMCQAAWAASHTKNTYLNAFYRRIQVRKGAPKAVMALAHHMLAVIYNVLSRGEEYVELGRDYYDRRNKPKIVSRLVERLTRLGYTVELKQVKEVSSTGPLADPDSQIQVPTPVLPETPETPDSAAIPARRRGRPCKCAERGIICKHRRAENANLFTEQPDPAGKFS